MMRRMALAALAVALGSPVVLADEVRLRDGRVLIGSIRIEGAMLHVDTADGPVAVPRRDVVRVRTADELRAELQALASRAGDGAFAQVELARAARVFGLRDEMWRHLDQALAQAADGGAAQRRLHELLADLEPELLPLKWRRESTETRVRELLLRLRPDAGPARVAAVSAVLAREPGARDCLRRKARTAGLGVQRLAAVRALSAHVDGDDERFVYRSALLDGAPEVRAEIADDIAARGRAGAAVDYLASALLHPHPQVRIRTAEALARLRAPSAVEHLVAAGPFAGALAPANDGGSVRGTVAFLEQTSFVRDFAVEVAQASFIADPKIDVVQSGVVLDATVHAVILYRTDIIRAWRTALRQLTGYDPGPDPRDWARWHAARRRASDD